LGILLPALAKARATARQVKCSTQLQQIHKSLLVQAVENSSGRFVLPGEINRQAINGLQIKGRGAEDEIKNSHANLWAACLALNMFTPKVLISPSEVSGNVAEASNYNFSAYNPAQDRYWDGDTAQGVGSIAQTRSVQANLQGKCSTSYACTPLDARFERRTKEWRNSSNSRFAVLGNRCGRLGVATGTPPQPVQFSDQGPIPPGGDPSPVVDPGSKTLEIHGAAKSWEGNICYNDNHVKFENSFVPEGTALVLLPGNPVGKLDSLFQGQTDSGTGAKGLDIYLTVIRDCTSGSNGPDHNPSERD
jgi:hypothetical protein